MNHWAQLLANLPATAQRLVARHQRITLPRTADAAQRLCRLREALCHAATVRATFACLDAETRLAIQDLRQQRGGVPLDVAHRQYGAPRAWRAMAAEPTPQNTTERLLLMGWLLPTRVARNHPARYYLPPELRRWLPVPLQITSRGAAPTPPPIPVLRAATALLIASAEQPLMLRADGRLRRSALQRVAPRLGMSAEEAAPLLEFSLPLLHDLGLLLRSADNASALSIVGERFLALSAQERLAQLRAAWLAAPRPDAWGSKAMRDQRGVSWVQLRQRLCAWVEALPPGQLLEVRGLYQTLAAHFGPLANGATHGYRLVTRVPWRPKRCVMVFEAALAGPLTWLGFVSSHTGTHAASGPLIARAGAEWDDARPWRYGPPGEIIIPHGSGDAYLPRLLRFARWIDADRETATYHITTATLALATSEGWHPDELWRLLDQAIGPLPASWHALMDFKPGSLRFSQGPLLIADIPGELARILRNRRIRRHVAARLAPGIALLATGAVEPMRQALAAAGVSVAMATPSAPPLVGFTADEYVAVAFACAHYRRHAPPDAPVLAPTIVERLHAHLPPPLRSAMLTASGERSEAGQPVPLPTFAEVDPIARTPEATLQLLRRAITGAHLVVIDYDKGGRHKTRRRTIRPTAIERRGASWLVHAYCTARGGERTFRVARIRASEVIPLSQTPGPPRRSRAITHEIVPWIGGDSPAPEHADPLDGGAVQEVEPHVVGVWLDDIAEPLPGGGQFRAAEVAFEDALLDMPPIALEQGEDTPPPPIVGNIVTDHREHVAPSPIVPIIAQVGPAPGRAPEVALPRSHGGGDRARGTLPYLQCAADQAPSTQRGKAAIARLITAHQARHGLRLEQDNPP
jgi:hypothetical protein